ncbi:hypothetical protein ACFL1G_09590 [Planctomycetota bacterium]
MRAIIKMLTNHGSIIATSVLFICFMLTGYAESGLLLEDLTVPEQKSDQGLWAERYRYYLMPNPDCCRSLALDGNYLWLATSAGAVCLNLKEETYQLFKANDDWGMEYAEKLGMNDEEASWRSEKAKQYLNKWAVNAVEKIIVLSPGHVWVDTFNGAMIIHGDRKVVYPSIEDTLTAIYHTDLRPTLSKIVAMDKNNHLWWRKTIYKEYFEESFELLHYDGNTWKVDADIGIVKARRTPEPKCNINDIQVDAQGNLWACNSWGIYQRMQDRWRQVLKEGEYYGFREMRLGASGTLWAFGSGRLAKLVGDQWEVFEGTGRYKDFSLSLPYMGKQAVVLETPDGKLWFEASYLPSDTWVFLCFDGKGFNSASFCPVSATSNNSGEAFAASGDRLFSYDKSKWKQLAAPPFHMLKLISLLGGKQDARLIDDILVTDDGTVFITSMQEGLFRYKNGSWRKIPLDKRKQEVKSMPQNVAEAMAKIPEEQRFLMTGVGPVPESLIQKMYQSYIRGDGEKLIKATNEQLSKHIVNIKDNGSVISYYRLVGRDKKLANISLREMIKVLCSSGGQGEFTSMQIACFGPQTVDVLLDIAQTGTEQERVLAIDSLTFMKDQNVVNKLLEMLGNNNKLDELPSVRLVRMAVASGKSEGMSILIQGATTEGKYQKSYQAELSRVTFSFRDVPDDWSLEKWSKWWQEHRNSWQPSGDYLDPMLVNSVKAQQRLLETVAGKIESEKH